MNKHGFASKPAVQAAYLHLDMHAAAVAGTNAHGKMFGRVAVLMASLQYAVGALSVDLCTA